MTLEILTGGMLFDIKAQRVRIFSSIHKISERGDKNKSLESERLQFSKRMKSGRSRFNKHRKVKFEVKNHVTIRIWG
jgi:hypothetical protein